MHEDLEEQEENFGNVWATIFFHTQYGRRHGKKWRGKFGCANFKPNHCISMAKNINRANSIF
jgi:hypothetical protein